MIRLASNEVEALNRARRAYDEARSAGVTGKDLATLKGALDAAQATVDSATGGGGGWGVLS